MSATTYTISATEVHSDDDILRMYLQAAHDRGGTYQMAMQMMLNDLHSARDNKPEPYGFGLT